MLGENLKKLRGKRTQDDIAKAIGISRARYSHYENGIREPDLDTLHRLADYFNATTDQLLGITVQKEPAHREAGTSDMEQEEIEFQAFANDPSLQKWYKELPKSEEEDLQKLRTIWEMIKNDVNK